MEDSLPFTHFTQHLRYIYTFVLCPTHLIVLVGYPFSAHTLHTHLLHVALSVVPTFTRATSCVTLPRFAHHVGFDVYTHAPHPFPFALCRCRLRSSLHITHITGCVCTTTHAVTFTPRLHFYTLPRLGRLHTHTHTPAPLRTTPLSPHFYRGSFCCLYTLRRAHTHLHRAYACCHALHTRAHRTHTRCPLHALHTHTTHHTSHCLTPHTPTQPRPFDPILAPYPAGLEPHTAFAAFPHLRCCCICPHLVPLVYPLPRFISLPVRQFPSPPIW